MRTKLIGIAAVLLFACNRDRPHDEPRGMPAPSLTVRGAEAPSPEPTVVPASPEQNLSLRPDGSWEIAAPHAVFYDATTDRYLVAAAGGVVAIDPKKADAKPERFLQSGKNGIALRSPRALAVDPKGTLYVTDGDTVHTFDAKSGAPKGDVVVHGATSLEGIAIAGDGTAFVSDSGLRGPDDKKPGVGGVFSVANGKATQVAKDKSLDHPTALAFDGDVLRVATWEGAIFALKDGKRTESVDTPRGQLDGLVVIPPYLWASSWKEHAVYRGLPAGSFGALITNIDTPGGLGYDQPRERILVPLVSKNRVEAYAEVKR